MTTRNAEALVGFNPDEIERQMNQLGEELAAHQAAASLLENLRKTVRAKVWFKAPETLKAIDAKNAWADAHEDYEAHIRSMISARELCDKARVRYESFKIWCDLKRTAASTERAMMNIR